MGANKMLNTRYFSGAQASIMIGDIWVDDIVGGSFTVTNTKKPIFGYGSTYFDAIAGGQEMVQGSLEINFREPNYLWMILAMKDVPTRSEEIIEAKKANFRGRKNIYAGDNPVAKMRDARLNYEALMGAGSDMVSQRANTLKDLYTIDNKSAAETLFGRHASDYAHNFFDIAIGYGDGYAGDNPNRIGEKIINCTIMGRAKQIEASGQPIREVYSFIGQKHI